MKTIRTTNGLSGFTKREESEYDPFGAGHSSTSVSAGLGMAIGRDMKVRGVGTSGVAADVYGDCCTVLLRQFPLSKLEALGSAD